MSLTETVVYIWVIESTMANRYLVFSTAPSFPTTSDLPPPIHLSAMTRLSTSSKLSKLSSGMTWKDLNQVKQSLRPCRVALLPRLFSNCFQPYIFRPFVIRGIAIPMSKSLFGSYNVYKRILTHILYKWWLSGLESVR